MPVMVYFPSGPVIVDFTIWLLALTETVMPSSRFPSILPPTVKMVGCVFTPLPGSGVELLPPPPPQDDQNSAMEITANREMADLKFILDASLFKVRENTRIFATSKPWHKKRQNARKTRSGAMTKKNVFTMPRSLVGRKYHRQERRNYAVCSHPALILTILLRYSHFCLA